MSKDKMREEFEAWISSMNARHPERIMAPGGFYYDDYRVNDAWQVWQASRAALEIEMPPNLTQGADYADGWSHVLVLASGEIGFEGVRVKPRQKDKET